MQLFSSCRVGVGKVLLPQIRSSRGCGGSCRAVNKGWAQRLCKIQSNYTPSIFLGTAFRGLQLIFFAPFAFKTHRFHSWLMASIRTLVFMVPASYRIWPNVVIDAADTGIRRCQLQAAPHNVGQILLLYGNLNSDRAEGFLTGAFHIEIF